MKPSEPFAVLGIAWLVLGRAVSATQIAWAFLTPAVARSA